MYSPCCVDDEHNRGCHAQPLQSTHKTYFIYNSNTRTHTYVLTHTVLTHMHSPCCVDDEHNHGCHASHCSPPRQGDPASTSESVPLEHGHAGCTLKPTQLVLQEERVCVCVVCVYVRSVCGVCVCVCVCRVSR
jgi:hypothetical protein